MAKHTAMQIAEWFLQRNRVAMMEEDAELISPMKLQKLLYYAQGSFLGVYNEPLFGEDLLAWEHGPVVECVYQAYRRYGAAGIPYDADFDSSIFTPEENDLLNEVYDTFGQYSASKLRNMTHEETPWKTTQRNHVIDTAVIKDYFIQEYLNNGRCA